jgi:hypothetical protein
MSATVHLSPEVEHRLSDEARRSGESLDSAANRLLNSVLAAPAKSHADKYSGLTPRQIDYQMDIEAYEEKLRANQAGDVSPGPRERFVVKPIASSQTL